MRRQQLVLGALLAAPLFGQGTYTIESIAPPAGFATATAKGINQSGLVTGSFTTAQDANSSGFLYDAQRCTLQSLAQINGLSSTAAAINNAGLVIGTTVTGTVQNSVPRGFASWHGFVIDLGGDLHERALGLNNSGIVVGSQTGGLVEGATFWRTCLLCKSTTFPWTPKPIAVTGPFDLPVVTIQPPAGTMPVTQATAINDSGQIAGWLPAGGEIWGVALSPGATTWTRIAPVPSIPGIPGLDLSTMPRAVNRKGNIVGVAGTSPVSHAFFSSNFLLPAIDLGTLNPSDPNTASIAEGINSNDWVVGTSFANSTDLFPHAFLYNGTSMIDLNTRVVNGQGWLLTAASAINDNGWIVGTGLHNNRQEGFVLVPQLLNLPNPCTPIVSVPFNGGPQ
jgi:probable HAF family extracellular repeat protein